MKNYLQEHSTLFAFNIWDINSAKAVMDAAERKNRNVILQTSASIYYRSDPKQLREFTFSYAKAKGIKVWLHLDHCRNTDIIKNAVENSWDSVMIDASDQDITENIHITNSIAGVAHENNVLVEAEIGQVRGVEDDVSARHSVMAQREEINRFLQETQIDMIAVAFGNAHGVYQGEPDLNYGLVEYTVEHTDLPFVVHGGSGLKDSALKRLLSIPGVKKINISTDVKLAYREGILQAYHNGLLEEEGFQAVRVEECIHDAVMKMACAKLDLLSG